MIRKIFVFLSASALLVAAGGASAAGDPKAGKAKSELCQGCHGPDGMSVNPECPNLAGQRGGYIIKQVVDFQKGLRNNDTMSAMAAMVTDVQDLKDIAAYFMTQTSMKGSANMFGQSSGNKKTVAAGKEIFMNGNNNGAYGCVNCHGNGGKGKDPRNHIFPVLGGQSKDYIMKQLKDFKEGTRTNDPAGMMGDIAKKLSDSEIEAVADYLSSIDG